MRVLLVRSDRLGDCLLATPALRVVLEQDPNIWVTFAVNPAWIPLLQYKRWGGELGKRVEVVGISEAQDLASFFKTRWFDAAVVLNDDPLWMRAIQQARVGRRIGNLRTLRSFFTYNEGIRQRRSRCEKHEAEYNIDLVTRLTRKAWSGPVLSWVAYDQQSAQKRIHQRLADLGIPMGFHVLHPGSRGSSRYLSEKKMIEWVARRVPYSSVILTAGPGELLLAESIRSQCPPEFRKNIFIMDQLELEELAELFRASKSVTAHGTGPLHLAAAVGATVHAIFPPIRVLGETRWGPLAEHRTIWTPDVPCPATYKCRGARCPHFDCMDLYKEQQ